MDADENQCEPKVEKDGKQYPPMAKNNPRLAGLKELVGGRKRGKKDDAMDGKDGEEGKAPGAKTTSGGVLRGVLTSLANMASSGLSSYTK
jgi:hypothetical protein